MAHISETGYAKNVANFESLITSIIAFDTTYNPSKESINFPHYSPCTQCQKTHLAK